ACPARGAWHEWAGRDRTQPGRRNGRGARRAAAGMPPRSVVSPTRSSILSPGSGMAI
ncbi:MAG: hypothetical protein AVDCRST_MAG26-1159, partial [uncultured Chloroflexia bacterium]